jgi:hypothetical protein
MAHSSMNPMFDIPQAHTLAGGSTQDELPYNIPIIVTFPCFIGQQIIFL